MSVTVGEWIELKKYISTLLNIDKYLRALMGGLKITNHQTFDHFAAYNNIFA